jgi:hypothetical protein
VVIAPRRAVFSDFGRHRALRCGFSLAFEGPQHIARHLMDADTE